MSAGSAEDGGWEVPGYRVGALIGQGGFASVYEGTQISLGRPVAVKVLNADVSDEPSRQRFVQEREALSLLGQHPHIVDVLDAGVTAERRPFIVMRLYRRGSLGQQIQRHGPLSLARAVDVVGKVAQALDGAHACDVLHRDVKPDNILLTDGGEPVLGDFGIAKLLDPNGERGSGRTSTKFFTMAHAAPEILEHRRYTRASDIYALASTAYEFLAGHPAFDPQDPRASTHILDRPVPPIGRPDVPGQVEQVIVRGMAKDPSDRPPSASAFVRALREASVHAAGGGGVPTGRRPSPNAPRVAAGRPGGSGWAAPSTGGAGATVRIPLPQPTVPGPSAAVPGRGAGPVRSGRRRFPAFLAGIALVVLVGGGGVWLGTVRPWEREPLAPERVRGQILFTLEGHEEPVEGAAYSPDGVTVATVGQDDTLRLWDARTGKELKVLTEHDRTVSGVSFSPDGALLATSSWDGTARIWDVRSGTCLRTLEGHDKEVEAVAFAPDGRTLATAGDDHTVRIWDTDSGQTLRTLEGHEDMVYGLAFAPDGATVASASADGTVRIWEASSGRLLRTLEAHGDTAEAVAFSPDGSVFATAGWDGTMQIWNSASGTVLHSVSDSEGTIKSVAFSPDGTVLAVGDGGGRVRFLNARTAAPLGTISANDEEIEAVVFSPDGRQMVVGGDDDRVRIWSILPG
jgi:eukaryotic-like serine/threonine-protein kinase